MGAGPKDKEDLSLGEPERGLDDDDLLEGARPRTRRVTFRAPPARLALPGENDTEPPAPAPAPPAPVLPRRRLSEAELKESRPGYDGWMANRLRRSSLPPAHASAIAASTVPPTPRPPSMEPSEPDQDDGGALDLIGRSTKSSPVINLTNEMAERLALDDFSGALRAAELLLGQDPANETALHYAKVSREKLEMLLVARLESSGRIPVVDASDSEIRWLGLDPKAGFLLSRIDGAADLDAVVDTSGMRRLDALKILVELVDAKVVRFV